MTRTTSIGWLTAITYTGIYGGLLMPLMFIPIVIFPFVFSKLIFFQILISLTFPAYLILAWIDPKYRPRPALLYLAIVSYFVAVGLSVIFSMDPVRSWWGNQERMNGLFTLLHLFAWLTMTVGLLKTWPQWRRLLNYQVGLSVFMAVIALLQKPFPRLLMFTAGARVGGLLDNPIYMAAYQIFNLFFIALLWMKGANRNAKIWYVIAILFDISAFIAASSRGALVGLAAGLAVFAVAYGLMTPNKKAKRTVLACVALAFIGYGLLFAARNTEIVQSSPLARFTSFGGARTTRFIAWDIAWKGFLDRPVTGWGIDTFHILFNEKYNPESLRYGYYETWFDRSHNTVMDILSMNGLVGLVTFVSIFIALFWSVIRAYRRGWIDVPITSVLISLPVAYFVQNLFVFDHPAAFSMSFLMYALVIVATTAQFNEKPEDGASEGSAPSPRAIPWIAFGVLQIVMLFVAYSYSLLPFRASMISIRSNTAFGQGRYEDAYQNAKKAFEVPTPYLDEQTFLQSRNVIDLAVGGKLQGLPFWKDWHDLIIKVSQKHLEAHDNNAHPRFVLARFTETLSPLVQEDHAIADEQFKKVIELSPKRQQMYYSYARFLIDRNRKDEAYDLLKQAVAFDPELGESHWMLGLHMFFDRRMIQEGATELAAAVSVKYPYPFKEAKELVALGLAYDALGKKEEMRKIVQYLNTLPRADLGVYLDVARLMERQGLTQERDIIVNALMNADVNLAARLVPLSNGSATSIDAALKLTESIVVAPASTSTSAAPTKGGSKKTGPRK